MLQGKDKKVQFQMNFKINEETHAAYKDISKLSFRKRMDSIEICHWSFCI